MARIPDQEVQRLKDEVAVQRLVEAAGVECCAPRSHRIASQINIERFRQDQSSFLTLTS